MLDAVSPFWSYRWLKEKEFFLVNYFCQLCPVDTMLNRRDSPLFPHRGSISTITTPPSGLSPRGGGGGNGGLKKDEAFLRLFSANRGSAPQPAKEQLSDGLSQINDRT